MSIKLFRGEDILPLYKPILGNTVSILNLDPGHQCFLFCDRLEWNQILLLSLRSYLIKEVHHTEALGDARRIQEHSN